MESFDLGKRIFHSSYLTGNFTLRSGAHSQEYFDKYLFESDPALLEAIAKNLCDLIPPDTELLAGLEMGGIPVVSMLSHYSRVPCLFVRKETRQHGTSKFAEGPLFVDRRVTIVEDIVSSGGQIILSTADLREAGALVEHAICVIDRQSGGREKLVAKNIQLHSLFTMEDLVQHQP